MGMTHTTLEIQSYPEAASLSSLSVSSSTSSSSSNHDKTYLSVKQTATSNLSPIIEEPSEYSSDCYEYDSVHQSYCSNGKSFEFWSIDFQLKVFNQLWIIISLDYYLSGTVTGGGSKGDTLFSYKVLPIEDYTGPDGTTYLETYPGHSGAGWQKVSNLQTSFPDGS